METGKHENVKIIGCGTGESSEKKTPYFTVEFENDSGESIESIHYLSENAKNRSLELLAQLGFKGKRISDLSNSKLKISDLFGEPDAPISITVEEEQIVKNGEPQWKDEAQTIPKMRKLVKWVNVGDVGGISKFDYEQAVVTFKELAVDGDLMEIMKSRKKKTSSKPAAAEKPKTETAKNDDFADDEIPF